MAQLVKITPNLWFDTQAEEAARFYTGIFKQSGIGRISYYTEAGKEVHKRKPGSVLTVEFDLGDQQFLALNGGPQFKFSEAVSFVVNCANQAEVDYFWEKLSEGGDPAVQQCGWLKDQFGLSWQIVPVRMQEMITDPDRNRVEAVMAVMMKMKKLNIAELESAFNGVSAAS